MRGAGSGERYAPLWWVALVTLLVSPVCAQDDVIGLPRGSVAPAVTIEDLHGAPVDLGRWVGKQPVLVEFWAAWCPQCAELLPRMEAARARFGERVAFLVVAVGVNQSRRSVQRHLQRHPMPFTFLWDANGAAVRAFHAPTTSYVVVLDAAGKVVYTGTGGDQDLVPALETASRKGVEEKRRGEP